MKRDITYRYNRRKEAYLDGFRDGYKDGFEDAFCVALNIDKAFMEEEAKNELDRERYK